MTPMLSPQEYVLDDEKRRISILKVLPNAKWLPARVHRFIARHFAVSRSFRARICSRSSECAVYVA